MQHYYKQHYILISALILMLGGSMGNASPMTIVKPVELVVKNAWIREAPPGVNSHAAYMDFINVSDNPLTIKSITAEGYGMTMLHKTKQYDGIITMEHIDALTVPPRSSIKLEPGALHIMLMNPSKILKAGDVVKMTIYFDGNNHQGIEVKVSAAK